MNGNKNGTAIRTRNYRNIKIAPTTRAIRSALAISATMLALSGSGAALAGTCAVTGLSEVTCNGVFTDDVTNTVPVINVVPDLTLVVGTDGTTTVDPAAGVTGISSTWGGDATVINYAEINTSGADGIYMYSDDTATVANYGSVYTYITGTNQEGLDVSALNDVSVYNGGDVTAVAAPLSAYNAVGILAYSIDGSTSVDNAGSIVGAAYDGDGAGIAAVAYDTVTVNNDGDILGSSFNGTAYGVFAYSFDGDANVTNQGTIEAYSLTGNSYGISVQAYGTGYVNNSGDVTSGGDGLSAGIIVYAYDASVVNSGNVYTTSNNSLADGIGAFGTYVEVDNSGTVYASGYYWGAGIEAEGSGDVTVTNSGTVTGESNGGVSQAYGIYAYSHTESASVDNSGSVYAYDNDYGTAHGIEVRAYYDATVTNSGSVYAFGKYVADGINATSTDGYTSVSVTDTGYVGAVGKYSAAGISADGYYGATVDNAGDVYAYAGGYAFFGGDFDATGISAYSYDGDAAVTNSGSVDVVTYGYTYAGNVSANGIAVSAYNYNASATNSGTVDVYAGYYAYGQISATGVSAVSTWGDASVDNSGTINSAAAGYGYNGVASYGALAVSYAGDASVTNSGTINSSAYGYGYYYGVGAFGAVAFSVNGDATVTNSGDITATADNDPTYSAKYGSTAVGIYSGTVFGDAYVDNSGSVTASATGYSTFTGNSATGISANAVFYDATVNNSGSVSASVYESGYGFFGSSATGIDAYTVYGTASVTNSGDVYASATGYSVKYNYATGINAYSYLGYAEVDNSGTVGAYVQSGYATGINANGLYGATVDNSGSVDASAYYGIAIGVQATAYLGDATVYNSGTITATSTYGLAAGVIANSAGYDVYVYNDGAIDVSGYFAAYGIIAQAPYGDVGVVNVGSIDVYAGPVGYYAYGVLAASVFGDVSIDNSGSIDVAGYTYLTTFGAYAYGVHAASYYGDVSVDNSGSINVSAGTYSLVEARATGVWAYSYYGDVSVNNSGSITVDSTSNNVYYGSLATGVYALSAYGGDTTVDNSGSIDVSASSNNYYQGGPTALGIYAQSYGGGDVLVDNSGSITVTSTSEGYFYGASATGVIAYADYGDVLVDNSGDISVTARSDYWALAGGTSAVGVYAIEVGYYSDDPTLVGTVTVNNSGSITVDASAYYGDASAAGVVALGVFSDVYVDNSGEISATATSGDYSYYSIVDATGINAVNVSSYYYYGNVSVINSGTVNATANTGYATYFSGAIAVGVNVESALGDVYVNNSGEINATANANTGNDYGYDNQADAYGIVAYAGAGYITIVNDGDVNATATSGGYYGYSNATGISALGPYVAIYNSGNIVASADNFATGIQVYSPNVYIYNSGSIEADGGAYSVAIWSQAAADDVILNYGSITGAIWTGYGNDYLYNGDGGEWNPGQTPSDFGAGDDTIVNVGTINMEDSVISLGTWAYYGNHFYNYGTVAADGVYNVIDMGGPQALVPSANPYAFYNYGVIDFQDGAADDMLTIVGDFAGDGDINVDVSGLDGTSDILYIDGSVVDGSTNTINVELLDLPESIESIVPMVYVSGDSVAGNFELGDVNWDEDNSFVSLDFSLIADIDASNTDPDVFSLGIEVTGLSDPGTLAASLGSSVQSLMNSQVGTWRQRMGVIDSFNKGGVALWARVFTDKGSFTPEHVAGNFGQGGNFDFDQKNSGVEGGIDFAVTDEFSIGLLVSKSQADIHLDDPGTGNADLDADTWGVYGTWISPNGFYLDASYRWMNFDVDLSSVAGAMETEGDAEAFNVEMGYAWTLEGGLKIEPQLQYTRTSVNNFDVLTTTTGMTFEEDGGDSSRGRLGVSIRKGFGEADNGWLWTPYATLSAVREFNGKSGYAINNTFFGETSVEGTSALLELGFTARHQNWAIYGGLNWQDGGAVNSFFGGQLGVRYTFGHAAPAPAPVAPPPAKTCADLDDDGDGVNNCDDKCLGSAAGEAVGADGCPVPPEPVMEPKPFRG